MLPVNYAKLWIWTYVLKIPNLLTPAWDEIFWKWVYLGPHAKFQYFETEIATFVGISKKLLLFYWKCCISWEAYKFAAFSINYVKLKRFNQLLQAQFIVANILVSLNYLNLLRGHSKSLFAQDFQDLTPLPPCLPLFIFKHPFPPKGIFVLARTLPLPLILFMKPPQFYWQFYYQINHQLLLNHLFFE